MTVLNKVITDLMSEFAAKLVAALGKLSLDEFVEIADGVSSRELKVRNVARRVGRADGNGRADGGGKGKRVRRTLGDIQGLVNRILAFVGKHEGGCTAEQIRIGLGIQRKELPRPIKEALAKKLLVKSGRKRATRYFAKKLGGPKTISRGKIVKAKASKKVVKAKVVKAKVVKAKVVKAKVVKAKVVKAKASKKKISKSNGVSAPVSAA